MTETPRQSARRIVHQVLREHANSPDSALAAAARAELTYRHQRERDALLAAGRAIQKSIARTAAAMAAAGRIVAAFGGIDALREAVRRSDQGECVAHNTPGVPATTEYDGDPVCADCAVDYLREDLEQHDQEINHG